MFGSIVSSVLFTTPADAHGFVGSPPSRNIHQWSSKDEDRDVDPHSSIMNKKIEGQTHCGGRYDSKPLNGNNWKPLVDLSGPTFETEFYLTVNHGGNHYLRYVCMDGKGDDMQPHEVDPKEWKWVERADSDRDDKSFDARYPFEFFFPKSPSKLEDMKKRFKIGKFDYNGRSFGKKLWSGKSTWKTPSGPCTHGVLRWQWETANSCVPTTFQNRGQPGMTRKAWREINDMSPKAWVGLCIEGTSGESFLSCSDVSVGGRGSALQSPNVTQRPAPQAPIQTTQVASPRQKRQLPTPRPTPLVSTPRPTTRPPMSVTTPIYTTTIAAGNETCPDNDDHCEAWALLEECEKNPGYMRLDCCHSCNNTNICHNSPKAGYCEEWADIGECDKNRTYMLLHCCASCRKPKRDRTLLARGRSLSGGYGGSPSRVNKSVGALDDETA